jgi:adenylosuccinate lyase
LFREVLVNEQEISKYLSAREIDELLDPRNYTGCAQVMIDRVLSSAKKHS